MKLKMESRGGEILMLLTNMEINELRETAIYRKVLKPKYILKHIDDMDLISNNDIIEILKQTNIKSFTLGVVKWLLKFYSKKERAIKIGDIGIRIVEQLFGDDMNIEAFEIEISKLPLMGTKTIPDLTAKLDIMKKYCVELVAGNADSLNEEIYKIKRITGYGAENYQKQEAFKKEIKNSINYAFYSIKLRLLSDKIEILQKKHDKISSEYHLPTHLTQPISNVSQP